MSAEEKRFVAKHTEQLTSEEGEAGTSDQSNVGDVSRRTFLRLGALASAGVSLAGPGAGRARAQSEGGRLEEATVAELQAAMALGRLTSVALTNFYINRIRTLDQNGPSVNSVIDRNACGSSSGSAAAVSSNFAAVSIGTETDGSIVCPANVSGVVGIKPTVGLTSRAGVVPISHTQDTVGPHGRTVADAAAVLNVIASRTPDPRDPATGGVPLGWQGTGKTRPAIPADYTAFVDPDGLRGARIGVTRQGIDSAPPRVI